MQLFLVDGGQARAVEQFGSRFSIAHLVRTSEGIRVSFAYLPKNGSIGRHEAVENQILVEVDGEGWVSGEDRTRKPIRIGQATFWTRGEQHETGSEKGLTALILEGVGGEPPQDAAPILPVRNDAGDNR